MHPQIIDFFVFEPKSRPNADVEQTQKNILPPGLTFFSFSKKKLKRSVTGARRTQGSKPHALLGGGCQTKPRRKIPTSFGDSHILYYLGASICVRISNVTSGNGFHVPAAMFRWIYTSVFVTPKLMQKVYEVWLTQMQNVKIF